MRIGGCLDIVGRKLELKMSVGDLKFAIVTSISKLGWVNKDHQLGSDFRDARNRGRLIRQESRPTLALMLALTISTPTTNIPAGIDPMRSRG